MTLVADILHLDGLVERILLTFRALATSKIENVIPEIIIINEPK